MDYEEADKILRQQLVSLKAKLVLATSMGEVVQLEREIDNVNAALRINTQRAQAKADAGNQHRRNFTPPADPEPDRLLRFLFLILSVSVTGIIFAGFWKWLG